MTWEFYVVISVLLFSANSLLHRILMKDIKSDPYAQTLAFYGLGGIIAFVIATFRGGFQYRIAPDQIPYFVVLTIFCTLAPILAFKAYKTVEASEATILFSSQRLWMVLGAFVALREPFSYSKIVGTIIILSGIVFALWKKKKYSLNRGVVFALLAAFSYAVADIASFFILRNFDVVSFSVFVCFIPVISLLILKPKTIGKLAFYLKPSYLFAIVVVTLSDTLASMATNFAYQVGRNAAQISPLMATQTITAVILAVVFLKERDHAVRKIIGALIVVIGVLFVVGRG